MQKELKTRFGVEVHERTVGKYLAALGYRRLSVRPQYSEADPHARQYHLHPAAAPCGGTEFQRKVWDELKRIPCGVTISHVTLAKRLGDANLMRAVGLANGRNPISIVVPCHRVIGADGSLTGYGGGLPRKEWLLKHEGALLI